MSAVGEATSQHQPHMPPIRSSSSSQPKPKGILKNARDNSTSGSGQPHNLQWDEENLALTEINKDSLMKITEPKTPYVRYNALTDEIEGDIPDFSLSGGYSSQGFRDESMSPEVMHAALAEDPASPPSRRTSFSGPARQGTAGSGTSSRSTSFNLPNEARKEIRLDDAPPGADEVEVDEEEMDEETAAKHAAFVRARKGHYSNEAEAMKRAAELMEEEDDDVSGSNAPSDVNDDDESTFGDEDDVEGRRTIPPVPPLPTHINGKNAGPSQK